MVLIALTRLVMNSYEKTVWMIMGIDPFLVAIVIKRKKKQPATIAYHHI